ncbi:MAG: GNAT family N-acetyltransferase, partial [Gemmatimonadota bacterium]
EDDDFDSFFRLHREIHERKDAPLYLEESAYRRYVERILEGGLGRLFHARLPGGRSVSTLLVLTGDHPVTHTVCAATEEEHLSTGASALIRWEAFRRLSEAGSTANDLTDAALNPVTRFKRQLGGDLVLNLVVHRTDSVTYRVEQGVRKSARRARGLARGGLRRAAGLLEGERT